VLDPVSQFALQLVGRPGILGRDVLLLGRIGVEVEQRTRRRHRTPLAGVVRPDELPAVLDDRSLGRIEPVIDDDPVAPAGRRIGVLSPVARTGHQGPDRATLPARRRVNPA